MTSKGSLLISRFSSRLGKKKQKTSKGRISRIVGKGQTAGVQGRSIVGGEEGKDE
jgi:hypothetical protein